MAANINKTKYANAIKTLYERALLERAIPNLFHGRWAMEATLSKFGTYEMRRYESLAAVTTSLSEGITPDEQDAPDMTVISVTPVWYGSWIQYTQDVDAVAFDDLVLEMVGILGEQAGLTVDTLIRNAVTAGFTARYSGGVAARASLDAPAMDIVYIDLLKAVAVLETNGARPAEGGMYPVLLHPHSWVSLMKDATFLALFQQEVGNSPIRSGMLGTVLNLKLYISSNSRIYVDAGVGSDDVYTALFFGLRAYGIVGMAGMTPSLAGSPGDGSLGQARTGNPGPSPLAIIRKGLGETGFDPLNQRATCGWKGAHEEVILNSAFGIVLEHTNLFSA